MKKLIIPKFENKRKFRKSRFTWRSNYSRSKTFFETVFLVSMEWKWIYHLSIKYKIQNQ